LDGHNVIDVQTDDSDNVVHYVENWSAANGDLVSGKIDQTRRLDNMRKHSGQHILSQAFIRTKEAKTISAHLGSEESTIELEMKTLNDEDIRQVELLANKIVLENQSIKIGYFERDELKSMKVRKIPDRSGRLRLIQIGDFDNTACGGTHCQATGEVGLIKIVGREHIRRRVRIIFLCGLNALNDYYLKNKVVIELTEMLTCHPADLKDSLENLINKGREYRKINTGLNKKLLPFEIENLIKEAAFINNILLIAKDYENPEDREIKLLLNRLTLELKTIVLFKVGDKLTLGTSSDVPYEASEIAGKIIAKFGGRGGGNKGFAQIGALKDVKIKQLSDFVAGLIGNE